MIEKMVKAGYIGAFYCMDNNQELSVTVVLWAILWGFGAIIGFATILYFIFSNECYEDKDYYKDTIPYFFWFGILFSLSIYFCLGTVSIFKWTFILLVLAWSIKTWPKLKKVYIHFNDYTRFFNGYTQSSCFGTTAVDFKTIQNLYQVSKHRFQLPKYYQNNFDWGRCLYELDPKTNRVDSCMVQLILPNFFEFLKFYVWDYCENRDCAKHKEQKQRDKDIESSKRNLEMVIAQAQVDIDMLKEKANAEINQANEMMAQVKENMKKANKA